MKLKFNFESVDMGDEIIFVPVDEGAAQVQGVLKMNNEGLEIVELLKQEITGDMIVQKLAEKYDNNREILADYVAKVLRNLRAADLLDE